MKTRDDLLIEGKRAVESLNEPFSLVRYEACEADEEGAFLDVTITIKRVPAGLCSHLELRWILRNEIE